METCPRDHALPSPELGHARRNTWAATRDLRLWSAHLERGQVTVAAGAKVRPEQSVASDTGVLFRLFVLDGPDAGDCVWLETDRRADLTRAGLRRAHTADEYWDMGPGQPGSEQFRCERGTVLAHLYAYAGTGDDADYPRCGVKIRFADTRPAIFGDDRCWDCERWFEANVWMPMVG